MHAVESLHSPTPEEIMEYLDGEGTPALRDRTAAHLETCATCQAVLASQRELSDRVHAWTLERLPPSLRAPEMQMAPSRTSFGWLSRPRFAVVTLGAVAAAAMTFVMITPAFKRPPRVTVGAPRVDAPASAGRGGAVDRLQAITVPESVGQSPRRASSVIRTATLHIMIKEFATARQTVEGIVTEADGFIDRLTVTGDESSARQLRGSLRVPGDRLAAVLTRLRALGAVTEDTQTSEDVTDQVVDLDARLASARATEKRLTELLEKRTGKLSDVLDVERELARVRLDIERLDAEKTNVGRRVTYATIDINLVEERKTGVDIGPLSLGRQLQLAALDGIENVIASAAGALFFALRIGPALLFWLVIAAPLWLYARRRGFRMRDGGSGVH